MALCQHSDVLLYLLPSIALAVVIRILASTHPFFSCSPWFKHHVPRTGPFCCFSLLTGARPGSFTIIPRRKGANWQLGSVTLTRVRWYNAAPAALAPFLIILIPFAVAWWRTRGQWHFAPYDFLIALRSHPSSCRSGHPGPTG
ncbi:hypothetical protein LP419_01430 [Massilia sp. H-1]|nr:hypothetical protein LP419_01430 [Massilia sp. H-1]